MKRPRLCAEFEASLNSMKHCLSNPTKNGHSSGIQVSHRHGVGHQETASSFVSLQMFAMKSSLEDMDALELDFRMRLAEVQRRYKEKQRELVKLQRRRDSG